MLSTGPCLSLAVLEQVQSSAYIEFPISRLNAIPGGCSTAVSSLAVSDFQLLCYPVFILFSDALRRDILQAVFHVKSMSSSRAVELLVLNGLPFPVG